MSIINTNSYALPNGLPKPPRESGKVTPPPIEDGDLYVVREGVPVLKKHTYKQRTEVNGEPRIITREIDEERLSLVAENSNRRADSGDYALLTLGHTDDDKPEEAQPPIVGYAKNFRVGEWSGSPCVLADFFVEKAKKGEAETFPRRSSETWYNETNPDRNFIDSIALLRRTPEQDLGLVTRYSKSDGVKLRFSMTNDGLYTDTEADMPLNDDDYAKIGEIISNSLQAGFKSFGDMLGPMIQHGIKSVLDGAAQEGGQEGTQEQNEAGDGEPDGDEPETSEADEPDTSGAEDPPTTDDDEAKQKNEAGSTASGTNTFTPDEIGDEEQEKMCADSDKMNDEGVKEKNRMREESASIKLARYERRLDDQDIKIKKLEEENKTLQRNSRKLAREKDLIQLEAQGYELDRAEELDEHLDKDDASWAKHVGKIKARYSRKPVGAEEVKVVDERPGGGENAETLDGDKVEKDREAFLKFARDNAEKYKEVPDMIEAWHSHKKAGKS